MSASAGVVALCVRGTFVNVELATQAGGRRRAASEGAAARAREVLEGLVWAEREAGDGGHRATKSGAMVKVPSCNSVSTIVPTEVDSASSDGDERQERRQRGPPMGATTTLMLRNIPNRCSQRALITELETLNLSGRFDFVYVPLDHRTMCNVGYAFVNFHNSETAEAAMKAFETHRFSKQKKTGKGVAASVAHIQGLEANLRHYERSAAANSRLRQRRPVVLTTRAAALLPTSA